MALALRRRGTLNSQQLYTLIDAVKNCPCIWNPEHEYYSHRSPVASSWTQIANQLQLPEDLLRVKWKNIRDVFVRESKRTKVTSADDYHGRWKYFKNLWFLYRVDTSERVLSEDDSSGVTDVIEPAQEQCEIEVKPPDDEFVFFAKEKDTSPMLQDKRACPDKASKSDQDDASDLFPAAPKRMRFDADDDCDVMFLKSLTPYFKLLKPIRKLVVRNKMQDIILKEIERSTTKGEL